MHLGLGVASPPSDRIRIGQPSSARDVLLALDVKVRVSDILLAIRVDVLLALDVHKVRGTILLAIGFKVRVTILLALGVKVRGSDILLGDESRRPELGETFLVVGAPDLALGVSKVRIDVVFALGVKVRVDVVLAPRLLRRCGRLPCFARMRYTYQLPWLRVGG